MSYTQEVEKLAVDLGVETSVAMDILYLRTCEQRIILAVQMHPELCNFNVYNPALESQLEKLGV